MDYLESKRSHEASQATQHALLAPVPFVASLALQVVHDHPRDVAKKTHLVWAQAPRSRFVIEDAVYSDVDASRRAYWHAGIKLPAWVLYVAETRVGIEMLDDGYGYVVCCQTGVVAWDRLAGRRASNDVLAHTAFALEGQAIEPDGFGSTRWRRRSNGLGHNVLIAAIEEGDHSPRGVQLEQAQLRKRC